MILDLLLTAFSDFNKIAEKHNEPVVAIVEATYTNSTSGTASWYGLGFHGRQTASGEIFDEYALTAAHPTLAFGTVVRVVNTANNKEVTVIINDRGPFVGNRIIDLSRRAAQEIDMINSGTARVNLYY